MTSLPDAQWHNGSRLFYRLVDGDRVAYQDECLYQSTAVERALLAAGGRDLNLEVRSAGGWHSLGTLSELVSTTWVRFEVAHPRSQVFQDVMKFLQNRVRGLSSAERPADRGHISVLFSYREDARAGLKQAELEFPGFTWNERVDRVRLTSGRSESTAAD